VTVYEIDQQAFAPLLINRPAMAEDLALSLSRRAQQVQAGAAQSPQQERSVHAFLRAIQTIFHRQDTQRNR
jgi:CRP-like cAMP-binding protein